MGNRGYNPYEWSYFRPTYTILYLVFWAHLVYIFKKSLESGFQFTSTVGKTRDLGDLVLIFIIVTLPETNRLPLKRGHPERKLVFQPSIFRCFCCWFQGGYPKDMSSICSFATDLGDSSPRSSTSCSWRACMKKIRSFFPEPFSKDKLERSLPLKGLIDLALDFPEIRDFPLQKTTF